MEIIDETTAHLTEETRQAIRELPFRKMRGMGNIVVHNYGNVDLKNVWEFATVHVPQIRATQEKVLLVMRSETHRRLWYHPER